VVAQVRGLGFGFTKRVLFSDLSLDVPSGVTWIHGGESCGKTTLLRLLAADLVAAAGGLQVNGTALTGQGHAYRDQVFWMDPKSDAFDAITPVAYWAGVQQRYPAFDPRLLADLQNGLSLAPHQDKAMYMLSTGSKRKVWLAAAFASGAPLTLLDEPFAALDKASIHLVLELLQEAAAHPARAWVVADYVAPRGVPLAATIALGD